MKTRVCLAAIIAAVAFLFFSCSGGQALSETDAYIYGLIDRHGLPSMAAVVIRHGERVYLNALGLRSKASSAEVTAGDAFHIGSNTKSMTAVLAAIAVQNGWVSWDDTIGGVLDGKITIVNEAYNDVTLSQLLTHTGGVPNEVAPGTWSGYFMDGLLPPEQRVQMAEDVLALDLVAVPGSGYSYSNFGYVVAGLMLETAAGTTWEDMARELLFAPLGMAGAGFGPPASAGVLDNPWGHNPAPVDPGAAGSDNPVGFNPAGRVHAPLADLEAFMRLLLAEGQYPPGSPLLTTESWETLTTPALNDCAMGLFALEPPGSGGLLLTHDGSNTMFYITMHLYPGTDSGVIAVTNQGDVAARDAAVELRNMLLEEFSIP